MLIHNTHRQFQTEAFAAWCEAAELAVLSLQARRSLRGYPVSLTRLNSVLTELVARCMPEDQLDQLLPWNWAAAR